MILHLARKGVDALAIAMGVLAGFALLYLIFGSASDVLLRLALGWGFPGILEYSEVVLVSMVYFSLAMTQLHDGHVSVEIVTNRLSPRWAAAVECFGLLIVVGVLSLVADRALAVAWQSYAQGEYRLGMSKALIWPVRFVIVTGLVALVLQLLLRIVALIRVASGLDAAAPRPDPGTAVLERNL